VVENAREHPIFSQLAVTHNVNIGSYIGVPIRYGDGTIVGTLCGIDPDPRSFRQEEIYFLQVLARLLAALLEHRAGVANRSTTIDHQALQAAQVNLQHVIARTRFQPELRQAVKPALLIDPTIRLRLPITDVLRKNGYRPVELFTLPPFENLADEIERYKPALLVLVEGSKPQRDIELIKHLRRNSNSRYLTLPVLYLVHQRVNQVNAYIAGASCCMLYTANIEPYLQNLHKQPA
jgi:hypothetical protein